MKKAKYLGLIAVIAVVAVAVSMLIVPATAAASTVTDASFIEAPSYGSLTKGEDYAYSFAVIGDTQSLNYRDVTTGTKNMQKLYQWIVDNQSAKNIQYVLGLGDITDIVYRTPVEDLYDANYGEWQNAMDAINLLNDKIPYSLVRGNHDSFDDFNASFGKDTYYYNNLVSMSANGNAGFYPSYVDEEKTVYKIENTWRKLEVGEHKYLIMTLDYGQDADILAWANGIIQANPDYKVIVTTHQFLGSTGLVSNSAPGSGPFRVENSVAVSELWDSVLSKHENVMMVLCGHIAVDDIVTTQLIGDNGNTVTCMLIDPQHMDLVRDDFGGNVGMVAMFYFSEDGSSMKVEWISTIRATDGDDTTHAYLKEKNQFSLDIIFDWVKTDHGFIPKSVYDNPTDHPFVLFQNGNYIGSNSQWATDGGAGAWVTARGKATAASPITILQRRDYAIASGGDKNVTHLNGNVIVDLGDNTLTTGSRQLFDLVSKKEGRKGNIEVYGGDIVISGSVLVDIRAASYANQTYNITFRDLDISFAEGTKKSSLVTDRANSATTLFANNIYFNNCNIDFTNAANGGLAFDLDQETEWQNTNVRINGGSITGVDFSNFKLSTHSKGYDTVAFGKYNGEYTKFILPTGTEMPLVYYDADNGGTVSFMDASDENNAIFVLVKNEHIDGYGAVHYTYADEQEYPFALYYYYEDAKNPENSGYVFLNAYKWWANSDSADGGSKSSPLGVLCQGVKYYLNNSKELDLDGNKITEVVVVLRRNYVVQTGVYNNFSQINGSFVVDLNNHTLTTGTASLYAATKKTAVNTYVTTKNGTILMANSSNVATLASGTNGAGYTIGLTFDNVKIGYATGAKAQTVISTNVAATTEGVANCVVTFNNCEFDLVTNAPSKVTLLNIGADADNNKANVTINGGSIKAGSNFIVSSINKENINAIDTLTFGKYNGSYTKFIGANVPTDVFDTAEGYKAVFGNVGETCTLVPAEFKILGAYLNITENINVCYAVGLPAGYTNPYMVFEFNGNKYTVKEYTVDATGKLIFKFVGVVPQMLGDNIKATLYATNGDTLESYEKAEYSVKTYCVNMLAKTTDTTLKTLLSDLLAYGAAAQKYNGQTEGFVNENVTGYVPTTEFVAPTKSDKGLTGEADASVTWNSVALRYENAMAMKFNFKADANLVLKITVNGRTTEYTSADFLTDENGNSYVYFRGILATEYGDVVTASFYNGDTQVGQSATYSVNSYVYSKNGDSNTALAELVKATYNYGASAEAYVGQ